MSTETAPRKKPTLVVEFLTADEYAGKVIHRAIQFMEAGVPVLWLIDPADRCAIVYRRGGPAYVVEAGGELTADDVIPGLRCLVDDFFPAAESTHGGSI